MVRTTKRKITRDSNNNNNNDKSRFCSNKEVNNKLSIASCDKLVNGENTKHLSKDFKLKVSENCLLREQVPAVMWEPGILTGQFNYCTHFYTITLFDCNSNE